MPPYRFLAFIYATFVTVRLSTGAFHVIYMLNTGIELHFIIFLTMIFSLVSFLSALFFGQQLKQYSHKGMTLFSILMASLYSFCLAFSPNKVALIASQIFYGISLASISVSVFPWMASLIAKEFSEENDRSYWINYYTHKAISISGGLSIFTASLCPILLSYFEIETRFIFILNGIIFLALSISLLFVTKNNQLLSLTQKSKETPFISLFSLIKKDPKILLTFFITAIFIVAMAPVYQFWQVFFQEHFSLSLYANKTFYLLAFFNFLTFSGQFLFNKLIPKAWYQHNFYLPAVYSVLSSIALLILTQSHSFWSLSFSYFIFQGASSIVLYSINNYILAKHTEQSNQLINIANIVQRFFSVLTLLVISLTINKFSITQIYEVSSVLFFSLFLVVLLSLKGKLK